MKKIVILGGGFGGIYTLKYLHKLFHKNGDIKLILINDKNYFLFTPLLHEVATGSISLDNAIEPIREIIRCCDFEFIHSKVLSIDLEKKLIKTNVNELNYDYLVIALGSSSNFYNIKGAEKYTFTLKSIDDAIKLKNHIIHLFERSNLECGDISENLTFVVSGGGATGVELSADLASYFYKTFSKFYSKNLIQNIKIILIQREKELLPQFGFKLRQKAYEILKKLGIEIILEKSIEEVGENFIKLSDGQIIKTKTVIWTSGVKPNLIDIKGNILYGLKNRIIVNEFLQVENYKEVFALGDIAVFKESNLPELAQAATKEAEVVASNIYNLIKNKPLKKFIFKSSGYLLSLGRFNAIGEFKNIFISGFWVWILWKGVYLSKMISTRDKIKTLIDWIVNLFLERDITEI